MFIFHDTDITRQVIASGAKHQYNIYKKNIVIELYVHLQRDNQLDYGLQDRGNSPESPWDQLNI